ncbi:hypothetical protein SRHO_G00006980 [Serrasalmus rhombeus]
MPLFQATQQVVMPSLRSTEKRLARDPQQAEAYCEEISNLFRGLNLNEALLPGPTLGASLLGVLLRFRQNAVAISGDIRSMFHQVRLLPEDRPLLKFVWRDMRREDPPDVYEWQVLPFGTTCSPCCATFALQRHVREHSAPDEDVRQSVEQCFYVDNCLQSIPTAEEARELVDKLCGLLATGGFELRQWASNVPCAISHLPKEAQSNSLEHWLSYGDTSHPESALGLTWHWESDCLGYKHRPLEYGTLTMRNVYMVLARQYDPLGYILPYTTRAKVLVQRLWDKQRHWDDPLLPEDLQQEWKDWEAELQLLPQISFPRPYVPAQANAHARQIHIFSDASERAYGSVAYLRSEDTGGRVHLSFLVARSMVAPRRQTSMPRLELCGAHTGAQLASLLAKELTLHIDSVILWTDSTTVLTWLQSESCRFKVFVGTRVSEIQELTDSSCWRYVDSALNPADDITRGKTLGELAQSNRWSQGPPFLLKRPEEWPVRPDTVPEPDSAEYRKSTFCGLTSTVEPSSIATTRQYSCWTDLVEATVQGLDGAAAPSLVQTASDYQQAEMLIVKQVQQDCFPEELCLLRAGKPVQRSSRLLTLSPELDPEVGIIRVGGRLRRAEVLDPSTIHPIILDPSHPATKLLIQDYDARLCHPGPERVFAEMRRTFWVLRGREAIRRIQHQCQECRRWKACPIVPKMSDLPAARLRLFQPPFYSTGVDCFGPFQIKIGRRTEKRWGIIFKCLTTRAVHFDLLPSIDVDSYLMALRRFIARRGTPAEVYSDQGTNFKGGEKELRESFASMNPELQKLLAKRKIAFHFNPPASPHFGGVWEWEIRSAKSALYTVIGAQSVSEEVLRTVLLEVEAILNSKPLGYTSSSIADEDPVTPNVLLMGRPDGKTILGTVQSVKSVFPITAQEGTATVFAVQPQVKRVDGEHTYEPWDLPVDVSHLDSRQQHMVKMRLREE